MISQHQHEVNEFVCAWWDEDNSLIRINFPLPWATQELLWLKFRQFCNKSTTAAEQKKVFSSIKLVSAPSLAHRSLLIQVMHHLLFTFFFVCNFAFLANLWEFFLIFRFIFYSHFDIVHMVTAATSNLFKLTF